MSGFFERIRKGLRKTGEVLTTDVSDLVLGKKIIDREILEELETRLIMADVGIDVTESIIDQLTRQLERKQLNSAEDLYSALAKLLNDKLLPVQQPLHIVASKKPFVLLVVGVNGVGKTTTIGKLAKRFMAEGRSVMLAAGDTFRAAAVEQLQEWGRRHDVPVVAQHTGADSASVCFDALQSAQVKKIDVLIADTAGRLHNKDNLMDELKKVVRVLKKLDPEAPHEVLLVLDAGTGQNAIAQTVQFKQAVDISGMALTKLDGTAKGGIIFALANKFSVPIRYIGVGEGAEDLQQFSAEDYVAALLPQSIASKTAARGAR